MYYVYYDASAQIYVHFHQDSSERLGADSWPDRYTFMFNGTHDECIHWMRCN